MLGMQYNKVNLLATGLPEVNSCFPSSISSSGGGGGAKDKKDGNFEPISVLDTRSPSPSTSTSTLSSSCGGTNGGSGGGGGTNSESTANLVAVGSSSLAGATVPLQEPIPTVTEASNGGGQKEEWVAELHGLQAGLESIQNGTEKFSSLGLDWDSIIGGQDQSHFKWVYNDVSEDPSCNNLKHQLISQGGCAIGENCSTNAIDGNGPNGVFGVPDRSLSAGFEALPAAVGGGSSAGTGNVLPIINSGKFEAIPNFISPSSNIGYPQNQSFSIPLPAAANNNLPCMPNGFNITQLQQQLQFGTMEQHKSPNFMPLMSSSTAQFQNGQQNFNLLNSLLSRPNQDYSPQPKRQNLGIGSSFSGLQIPKVPPLDPDPASILRKKQQQLYLGLGQHQLKPFLVPKQEVPDGGNNVIGSPPPMAAARQLQVQQQQVVHDQLYMATELTLAGNFAHAQGILARLNHHLSPAVKPFHRAAFYFKEALQMFLLMPPNRASKVPTPLDGLFKMGAYKMFSEVSPLIQFMNFTSNQVLLEALDDNTQQIHVIDFDIGCGAQWSSFMQELPKKNRGPGAGPTSLKITAFASPTSYDSVEISLIHESLSQFAHDLGMKFELEVVNFDSFDPSTYAASSFRASQSDTILVNFPLWSISSRPAILPSLLCFIKQLSPKVMVMLNQGCERFELQPQSHLLNALQYYEVLLDSIDAATMAPDGANKIERFLIQPNIESIVFGRMQCPNQIPPASNLLASAGFSTMTLSNFVETQAECVVTHSQLRGFHVEKRKQGSSLVLYWQRCELLSASIWKC